MFWFGPGQLLCPSNDFGIDRIVRGHGEESGRARDPGGFQDFFLLRITDDDGHTQVSTQMPVRAFGVLLDDDHPLTGLVQGFQKCVADVAQPAKHNMAMPARDLHLQPALMEQRPQRDECGVRGHRGCEEPCDVHVDPHTRVGLGIMEDEELEAVVEGVGRGMIVLKESHEAEHKRRDGAQADHPPLVIAPKAF